VRAAAALLGAAMLAVPALAAPVPALAVTAVAALLLICSLAPRTGLWTWPGTLTASVAVLECVIWPPGTAALAVEGLLILGFLVLLDGPEHARLFRRSAGPGRATPSGRTTAPGPAAPSSGRAAPAAGLWLRGQARYGIAGLAAAGVVLVALAVPSVVSPWVVLVGLAAAAAAYLVGLPHLGRSTRP
jgi:hypothetical protein